MKAHSTWFDALRRLSVSRDGIRRGLNVFSLLAGLAAAGLMLAPLARAQAPAAATGSLAGTVADSGTGRFLEGADVSVEGTNIHVATSRDGAFELSGVPAGSHTLVVTYPGLETGTVAVNVGSDNAPVIVKLSSDVMRLGAFKVTGVREGMSQAVALQKISIQSKMVAASDQFGEVSEGNIGEYLKFMPGVTIDYNVNDARGVSLRGLSTAFTIVAVDGTPMAGGSSTDDTRRFEFEQIAMNNVATTELFKSVTPDIPAGSTGGFVNFVTKSAFDTEDIQKFTYNVSFSAPSSNLHFGKVGGLWGHEKEFTVRPSLEMNYSRKLTEKVGINVNYRLSEKYDDSPRTEFTWNTGTTAPTVMTTPRLQQYNIRQEEKLTHREAFATKLDFKLSDRTKFMVTGQWNWYDLNFTQRGPQFVLGTAATVNGDAYTSGTGGQIQNGTLYREKYGTTYHFNSTFSHEFDNKATISITPYWSLADSQYRDTQKGFISSVAVMAAGASTFSNFTLTSPNKLGTLPTITLAQGATAVPLDFVRNLANYTLSNTTGTNFQSRPWTAKDNKDGVRIDYSIPLDLFGKSVTFATGVEDDKTHRHIDRPDYRGNIPALTGAGLAALADPLYTKDVALGFGSIQAIDPYKVWGAYSNNLTLLSALDIREIYERNKAFYGRFDVNLTPELLLVGGARWEKRTIDANAQTGAPARAKRTTANVDFDAWYPSATLRYTPVRNIVVRTGASRTVGMPDYGEMLPSFAIPTTSGGTDGTIAAPASNLKPYFTNNYDFSIDYYLKNSGVITLSFYRKDVKNFIITRTMTAAERTQILTDYGFNPADFGNTSGSIRENGPRSRLQGFEFTYAQNLTFLPGLLNGLSVQANYTYTDISAFDSDPYRQIDTLYSQRRAVSPKTANVILGYRYRDFNATITTNWVDESLYGGFVNTNYVTGTANTANPALDTRLALYKDEKTTTDVKLEYSFSKQISAYFLIRNVLNTPRKEFLRGYLPQYSNVVLPLRYFEFGEPHLTVGVRGTF